MYINERAMSIMDLSDIFLRGLVSEICYATVGIELEVIVTDLYKGGRVV